MKAAGHGAGASEMPAEGNDERGGAWAMTVCLQKFRGLLPRQRGRAGLAFIPTAVFPETLGSNRLGDAPSQGAGGAVLMVPPRARVEVNTGLGSSSVSRITGPKARSARKSTQAGMQFVTGV